MSSPSPDPTSPPWPQYAEAIVEISLGAMRLELTPTDDPSPAVGQDGTAVTLPPGVLPLWVLTAGDPYPETLGAPNNAARNARLRSELELAGLTVHDALGRAPDGSTAEVSLAVGGTDRTSVLAHAARHGQLAVYEVDDRIRCVSVDGGHEVTARPYEVRQAPLLR